MGLFGQSANERDLIDQLGKANSIIQQIKNELAIARDTLTAEKRRFEETIDKHKKLLASQQGDFYAQRRKIQSEYEAMLAKKDLEYQSTLSRDSGDKVRDKLSWEHTNIERSLNKELSLAVQRANEAEQRCKKILEEKHKEAERIIKEASTGFPWLARAIAHYETLFDYQAAEILHIKLPPSAQKSTDVREVAKRSRQFKAEYYIARSRLDYYETLFPWLEDYVDVDLDTLIADLNVPVSDEDNLDPVKVYFTPGEYERLKPAERNQKALDRWISKSKNSWEIGRMYERYTGYCLEQDGYNVEYYGATEGLSDMGRDLIASKGNHIRVVQCKYWSHNKTIHEKHIAQLFGTTSMLMHEKNRMGDPHIVGQFITSTVLSDVAKSFANKLGISFKENVPLKTYPMIKCNIGVGEDGNRTKIYHLPFDQQYDKVKISKSGECYVYSVAEAEKLGFRRAFRWKGLSTGNNV